jgi:hypothetical protein
MKITLEKFLLIIILVLLIYNGFFNKDSSAEKYLQQRFNELQSAVDSIYSVMESRRDTFLIKEKQLVEIKNYYINKNNEIDTIKTDADVIAYIRKQLSALQSGKNSK